MADKQIAAVNLAASWFDGASIHHDGWPVEPGHGQNDSWHVLVTSWEGYVGVVPLSAHHSLYAVGYDVARGQTMAAGKSMVVDSTATDKTGVACVEGGCLIGCDTAMP